MPMTQTQHGADASTPAASPCRRKLLGIPEPTHKLLSRVSMIRGENMSVALYSILRDELQRQEAGEGWSFVPSPFSIKPTYFENECLVLFWNPFLPTLKLTGSEAVRFADALEAASNGVTPSGFEIITSYDGHRITIQRGGYHVMIHVDDERFAVILPVAADLALALDSASVHAGPLPTCADVVGHA